MIDLRAFLASIQGNREAPDKAKRPSKEALAEIIKQRVADEQARMAEQQRALAEETLGVLLENIEAGKFSVRADGDIDVVGWVSINDHMDSIGKSGTLFKSDPVRALLIERLREYDLELIAYDMGSAILRVIQQEEQNP
jgi:hypothetical protein